MANAPIDRREFANRLSDRLAVRPDCPICGEDEWFEGPQPHAISEVGNLSEGVVVFPFLCRNCGFVRLHSPRAIDLGRELEDERGADSP